MLTNWLSIVTGFVYMVLGVFVITRKWFVIPLEDGISYLLGGLMVAYGAFRITRSIYRLKESKKNEN